MEVPPWTVKGVPREDRETINRAAKAANLTVGAWLRAAARHHLEAEPPPPPGGLLVAVRLTIHREAR